jgi:hypothetical protein
MSLGTPLLTGVSVLHAGCCTAGAAGAASWLHLHAQIQARRAGCIRAVRCAVQDARQCDAMHGMRCASRCAASWLQLHAQIQARRAGCSCMRRYRRGELVAVACVDTGAASWLQLHAQIQARRAGCSCMRRYRRSELVAVACADTDTMLLTEGFLGWEERV